jgi:hypothetical protein
MAAPMPATPMPATPTTAPTTRAARPEAAPLASSLEVPKAPAPSSTRAARPPRNAEPLARSPAAERSTRVDTAGPVPTADAAAAARCGDILQKASLEPLSAAEVAYLKRECR